MPTLQARRREELAVGVEVVDGLLDPERVAPDLEGLREAMDVLGDPELGDPGRVGGFAVPSALAAVKKRSGGVSSSSGRRWTW